MGAAGVSSIKIEGGEPWVASAVRAAKLQVGMIESLTCEDVEYTLLS